MRPLVLLASLLLACGSDTVTTDGGAAGSMSDGTTNGSPTDTTSASASTSTSTSGADETSQTSVAFVEDPDLGQGSSCDMFTQDCPAGLKCIPYAANGGSVWTTTGCLPVVEDPAKPGEPCTMEGGIASGIDTCAAGSMCFHVDPDTLEGTCVALCLGDDIYPYCEDPGAFCVVFSEGLPTVCLPACHPLEGDCPEDQVCHPVFEGFLCGPDAPGDMGAAGNPCDHEYVCDPGTFCASPEAVPECMDSLGCCSSYCTLGDDSPCLPGQTCQPWYDRGNAPPGYEDLGACALP